MLTRISLLKLSINPLKHFINIILKATGYPLNFYTVMFLNFALITGDRIADSTNTLARTELLFCNIFFVKFNHDVTPLGLLKES